MQKEKLTDKQRFWQGHIEAHALSGLTRRDYCEQHSLVQHQMSYFATYLKKKSVPSKSQSGFVKVPTPAVRPLQMTIRLANGVSIECPTDIQIVSEVLRSLH